MFANTYLMDRKKNAPSPLKSENSSISYLSRTIVHPKLEMTEPGDSDELEADAVANDVMEGKVSRQISGGGAGGGLAVSTHLESRLNARQGGGQVLPEGLRNMMERGFNRDFSQVRLHTDSEAADMSGSISAKAFTHGNDIYFNRGQFSPNTTTGQRLVAHELAHVAQGGRTVARDPSGPTIGPDHAATKKEESMSTTDFFSLLFLFKSALDTYKIFRNAEAGKYVGDLITTLRQYDLTEALREAYEAAQLAQAGQGAARAVSFVMKGFDVGSWIFSSIMDVKRAYDYRHEAVGFAYYSLRALATLASCPYLPLPPTVKGLLTEFNTISGIGDLYASADNAVFHPYRRAKEVGDFYGGPDSAAGLVGFGLASIPGLGDAGEWIGKGLGAGAVALGIDHWF